jgi:predicted PurR-regulated permease PerM
MPGIDARALRVVWTIFLFALAVGFVYVIRETLIVFALALFLAQLLSPVVDLVERFVHQRKSRTAALVTVYVLLLAAAVAILAPLGSKIGEEASALATRLPDAIQSDPMANLPLPAWLESVRPRVTERLREQMTDLDKRVLPILSDAGKRVLSGLGNLLSAILIPILSFFFLKDGGALRDTLVASFPPRGRTRVAAILTGLHALLLQYTRALVLLSIATFLSHAAFLSATGVPYSVLLAGIAAILEFIPVAGPIVAAAVMLLVAAFAGYPHVLWIAVFLAAYRVFQDYVLNPYLMSEGVALHPLLVLFAVFAGEQVAGIPGMFFAVPAVAALRVILLHLREEPHEA